MFQQQLLLSGFYQLYNECGGLVAMIFYSTVYGLLYIAVDRIIGIFRLELRHSQCLANGSRKIILLQVIHYNILIYLNSMQDGEWFQNHIIYAGVQDAMVMVVNGYHARQVSLTYSSMRLDVATMSNFKLFTSNFSQWIYIVHSGFSIPLLLLMSFYICGSGTTSC